MAISSPEAERSLFLSCSISLVLISMFILIDIEKFTIVNTKANQTSEGNPIQIEDASYNTNVEQPNEFSCYEIGNSSESNRQPWLTNVDLESLRDAFYNDTEPLSKNITHVLAARHACGYVDSVVQINLKKQEETKIQSINEILGNYLILRKKLSTVSPKSTLKVSM